MKSFLRPHLAGLAAASLAGCFAISMSPTTADETDDPLAANRVAEFMRVKLDHSEMVLEGLAVEDYDKLARAAQALALASQAASWQVLQTEQYARESGEFRRACITLRDAAKARNLDAATLAWMEVTLKCVQCHRHVRDSR